MSSFQTSLRQAPAGVPQDLDRLSGEFASRAREAAFLELRLAQTRSLLGFALLFCTLFYVAFAVTDLVALGYGADFLALLWVRLLVALTAGGGAWLAYRRPLTVSGLWLVASVSEAVALGSFMLVAMLRPEEFHWHAMSLAIMLIVVYLYIPNSFANTLLLAWGATAAFLVAALQLGQLSAADLVTMSMLLLLANAFGALAARRFNRAAREEFRAQVRLRHAAERDHLTGCHNRRYLQERLMKLAPGRAGMVVILCDIDHFKRINDTYGHADGDQVIRNFGRLLRAMTGKSVGRVVRYGGEEFLAILPATRLDEGIAFAEDLRARFGAAWAPRGDGRGVIRATASFGVVCAAAADDGRGPAMQDLIDAADQLMYEAKRDGRNCVRARQLA